ncbi:hypothetical protein UlMin_007830 [Ulmus minor]
MALFQYWLIEPTFLFSLIFLVIFLRIIFKLKPRKSSSLNLLPSPPKLPIIGNLHQLSMNKPHISFHKLAQKYGPIFSLQLGELPIVIVSSARLAEEELFKNHDIALSNRPQIISAKHIFYNCTDIGFSPYGAYRMYIRKICLAELLSTKRVQSFSFVREEEVARLVSRVVESCPGTVSLSKLLGSFANNVVCRVAFGMNFTGGGDYDKPGVSEVDMFAAGTDTIFIALDWAMTELVMNPKAMEEAQAEVRSVVGKKRFVLECDIPHMNYLKAVIKENYRLHPPAPFTAKRLFRGIDDPEIWEDPETFKPERFIGSNIDFKGTNFELIPFGVGRRICPGMNFGTVSFELALAQLLHSFDWELPPDVTAKDLDMAEFFGITMHRKEGLVVLAKPHFL